MRTFVDDRRSVQSQSLFRQTEQEKQNECFTEKFDTVFTGRVPWRCDLRVFARDYRLCRSVRTTNESADAIVGGPARSSAKGGRPRGSNDRFPERKLDELFSFSFLRQKLTFCSFKIDFR